MFKKILSAGLLSLAAMGAAHGDGPVRLFDRSVPAEIPGHAHGALIGTGGGGGPVPV